MEKGQYEVGDHVVVRSEGSGNVNGKKLGEVIEAGHDGYGVKDWYRVRFDGTSQREDPWGFLFWKADIVALAGNGKRVVTRREREQRERLRQIEKLVAHTGVLDEWDDDYWRGKVSGENDMIWKIRRILHTPVVLAGDED